MLVISMPQEDSVSETLTKEMLGAFGPNDHFHLFSPETGERHVAKVREIRLRPRENDNSDLIVVFEPAVQISGDCRSVTQTGLEFFETPVCIAEMSVGKRETGMLEVTCVEAEHVMLFVNPNSSLYAIYEPALNRVRARATA